MMTIDTANLWRGSSYAVAKNLSGTISVYIIYYGICNNKLHLESTLLYLINPITIDLNWYLGLERASREIGTESLERARVEIY